MPALPREFETVKLTFFKGKVGEDPAGFKSRVWAKVAGLTVLQSLNKFINNQPVERVKQTLAN